jgi:hypothetical protein
LLKKAFVAILALLYLAVASGIEMNIHYCMGEIASVEYGSIEKGPCGKCGMESKSGCCEDETNIIKIDDSHQLSQPQFNIDHPVYHLDSPFRIEAPQQLAIISTKRYVGAPPGKHALPLYLANQVFRI